MSSENKIGGSKAKGFAAASQEERDRRLAKSLRTRKRNKAKKILAAEKANKLRGEASLLRKEAEALEQEADSIDGMNSSDRSKKKHEAQLAKEITERFGRSVSPQYLKQMIAHAILRGQRVDDIVTPTFAAMDVLQHPDATRSEKEKAIKMLQSFESAKPATAEDEKTDVLGSVEDQMKKLRSKHEQLSPKN